MRRILPKLIVLRCALHRSWIGFLDWPAQIRPTMFAVSKEMRPEPISARWVKPYRRAISGSRQGHDGPPRDPVNAMLGFCYGLLVTEFIGAVESVGLDYQMGFFHRPRSGRPSLALDLAEELRGADRPVRRVLDSPPTGRPGQFRAHAGRGGST